MDRCRFSDELSSYLDNQLSERKKIELQEHLKGCKICSLELERLKALSEKLKTWQAPGLDAHFDNAVRNKIVAWELERGQVKMKRKTLAILVPSGVLATILAFLFIGNLYFKQALPTKIQEPLTPKPPVKQPVSAPPVVSQLAVPQPLIPQPVIQEAAKSAPQAALNGTALGKFSLSRDKAEMYRGVVALKQEAVSYAPYYFGMGVTQGEFNTEQYDRIYDNDFQVVRDNPLSTFSIDVDTASYSNVRRFLNMNQMPPKDAVRIEEMINYFSYDYPQPQGNDPFSVTTEVGTCPWNKEHKLVLIGLQGKKVETKDLPKSNLVFLLDVSGSMDQPNKLPLVKSAFRLLVNQLRPEDRISIVVYAGSSGVVLDSARGDEKEKILQAIDNLHAGGSTAGGAGIQLAYEIAKKNLLKDGNNRVILATDGDFNIGVSDDGSLTRLIEEKRNDGIFLSILGFGMGNYKDAKMEKIADKGNGTLAYIDNLLEAKKVFVTQLSGTLLTIAKDVKIQVEFNPAKIKAYRLIGYENRMLQNRDFNDDKKDAGEIGAGHCVTALYEIVSADSKEEFGKTDTLQYQKVVVEPSADLLTVKLRYKEPNEDTSKLLTKKVSGTEKESQLTENFNFASAVAEFGLILRDSQYKGSAAYPEVLERARAAKGKDADGYRAEFIKLVELAQLLDVKSK